MILVNLIRELVRCCDPGTLSYHVIVVLVLLIYLYLILLRLKCQLTYFLDVMLPGLLSDRPNFVIIVLLVAPEYVSGLHCTTSLWTQEALHHLASLEPKDCAVVADPVDLRDGFEPET